MAVFVSERTASAGLDAFKSLTYSELHVAKTGMPGIGDEGIDEAGIDLGFHLTLVGSK